MSLQIQSLYWNNLIIHLFHTLQMLVISTYISWVKFYDTTQYHSLSIKCMVRNLENGFAIDLYQMLVCFRRKPCLLLFLRQAWNFWHSFFLLGWRGKQWEVIISKHSKGNFCLFISFSHNNISDKFQNLAPWPVWD